MNLSVFGLGKLGAPMAAVFAQKGHTVIGVDVNPAVVRAINSGKAPVYEPGLERLIRRNRDRLRASPDGAGAVAATDATFIIVPTPSEPGGAFSLRYVLPACETIGLALRRKRGYHLVVLCSTVMPGSTEGVVQPALEQASGRRCGPDFGLCYNPEFIALGSVIHDMLHPDLILIGESDGRAGDLLASLQTALCENDPRVARMNFVNAELTKLSVNTFITAKISYANMLAQLCERLPGADIETVTGALGCDSRIGSRYLKGALGYGGPCFPRDNLALAALAAAHGVEADLAEATDRLNRRQAPRVADWILRRLPEGGLAGILGFSYKPGTDVIEEAQGLAIARLLLEGGARVIVYDPAALDPARRVLDGAVTFAPSVRDCVRRADVLAIATPWPEFARIDPSDLARPAGRPVILDCWRLLDPARFAAVAELHMLGAGPRSTEREPAPAAAAALQEG